MDWLNRILANVRADTTIEMSEAETAALSKQEVQDLLVRIETKLQAALAKAQAANRRASKLQTVLLTGEQKEDVSLISQLAHEQRTAKSFDAHANQLSEVHRRVKSALTSGTPKPIDKSEPRS